METKKILMVDFKNKKVIGGYEGPNGSSFIPLTSMTEVVESRKRVTEAIERIDRILEDLALLTKKEDKNGN